MIYEELVWDEMKAKKYILFDLDGTLTDPKEGITKSVAYALDFYGIHVENLDTLCKFIGPPLKDSFMKYYGFEEKQAEEAVEKYREYFRPYGVYENKMYDGVDNLLQKLKESGKAVVLATSKPTVFAKVILEHFDLMKYFDVVCGSELDGSRVTKGDVVAYALEQLQEMAEAEGKVFEKNEAVMIGDREHDIIGAKQNGLDSIGVLFGYGCVEEFEEHGADKIVETVEELLELLV